MCTAGSLKVATLSVMTTPCPAHLPRLGRSQHSGWRCSTEHHVSWSTESSGVNPAPHPAARKHASKRSDSPPNIAVRPRGHSKARTETTTALRPARDVWDRHSARCRIGICACLPQYVAQGALDNTALCHATPFRPNTPSSSGLRRNACAGSSSANNLLDDHVLYRVQYLPRYLTPRCSYRLDRYQAARLLPHLAHRLRAHPQCGHGTHLGYWQQTTWRHTRAEVVGAVPCKLARKIIFAVGVSPCYEAPCVAQPRALLTTWSPVDAAPRTTVTVTIPRKVRASGRIYVAERPPVCVARIGASDSLPAAYGHAVRSDIDEARARTCSQTVFGVSPRPRLHGDATMPSAAALPVHSQASMPVRTLASQ
jgi:hypothetical protein